MIHATHVVVDTDVVSFLFKVHPLAAAYHAILAGKSLALSLMTLAEIEYGMEAKNQGVTRRALMRRYLDQFTVLLPDIETPRIRAQVRRGSEMKGQSITTADALIAATAVQLNIPLVSHNASDYRGVDNLVIITAMPAV